MGKRSSFARIPRDHYPTPMMAVEPLVPHLRAEGIRSFAEPCDGGKRGGHLVRHLELFGFVCSYRVDIADDGKDARLITAQDVRGSDAVITNPPHSRTLMHEAAAVLRRHQLAGLALGRHGLGLQSRGRTVSAEMALM